MHRVIKRFAMLAVCCWAISGCAGGPDPDADRATVEQRWTNVMPSAIGPYTCTTPFNPMYQAWPSSGFCQTQPAYNYPVQTSPLWRVSSCDPQWWVPLPRATVEITLTDGKCARLWGALNGTGSYWDFDITGAYGWRNVGNYAGQTTQIYSARVAHDTQLQFCTGPMSQGNPCQPVNPPNFPVTAIRTESTEVSATVNSLLKIASLQVGTW